MMNSQRRPRGGAPGTIVADQRKLFFEEPDGEFLFRIDAALKYRNQHFALRLKDQPEPRLPESVSETAPLELRQ